jgi:hypothetical protein
MIKKIFTKRNLIKLTLIFTVGLISRYLVNTYFNINVFSEFIHPISIIYYFFMSTFIVFVHELVHFDSLPSLYSLFSKIFEYKGFHLLDFIHLVKSFFKIIMFGNKDYLNVDSHDVIKEVDTRIVNLNDKDSLVNNKGKDKGKGKMISYDNENLQESDSNYDSLPSSPDSSKSNSGLRRSKKVYSLADQYKTSDSVGESSKGKQVSTLKPMEE